MGLFIFLFVVVASTAFLQKSPTADEPVHLFAGYSYLKWGDFRANPEHPPLAKMWAALPLLMMKLNDSRGSGPAWDLIPQASPDKLYTVRAAGEFLFVRNDADALFLYAKLQMVGLAVLLGVFVYRWSRELFGLEAAITALFLYCFDPNILAHSQIVHTDVAFAAMFFIATYFFWRSLQKLTWANLIGAALFSGLAAITKYAYLAIFFVWVLLALAQLVSRRPQQVHLRAPRVASTRGAKARLLAGILACCAIAAYVFIWAAYGFRFDAVPEGMRHLPLAEELAKAPQLAAIASFLARHHLFPEAWIYGQLYVFNNLAREAYLLGRYSDHGFWLYFPVAFAVKTPVPTMLLLIGTVALWIHNRKAPASAVFLVIPIAAYFALAIWSHINIGLRHVLPIYPFLFVLIGGTAAALWKDRTRLKRGALLVLVLWYLGSAAMVYPHYLAYFNELAGGSGGGHKFLLDSNIDWGQDLKGLKRWMDQSGVKKIQFLYFGYHDAAEPRYYGIDAQFLPGSWVEPAALLVGNAPGLDYLAISVHQLFGYFLRGERREDFVRPFRSLKPIANVGYSILIYRISDAIEELRRAVKAAPASAQVHGDLAGLLENQGVVAEAAQEYRQAIALDPRSTKALHRLGIILTRQGDMEDGLEHLRRAAETRPLDPDIHYDLAIVLAIKNDLEQAISEFRKTVELDPTYTGAHYNLGVLLAKRGDADGAIEELQETIAIDATHAKAHYQLAVLRTGKGQLAQAISQLQQALQIEPEFAEAHEQLARALGLQGRKDEALKHYEAAVRIIKSRAPTANPR